MCSRGLPLENDIPRSKPPLLNFHSPLFLLRCSLVIPSDSWLVFENFHPESFCLALWDFGRGNFFLMESVLLYFCFNSPVSCSFTVYPVFILISFFHLLSFIFSHILYFRTKFDFFSSPSDFVYFSRIFEKLQSLYYSSWFSNFHFFPLF